MLSPDLHEVLTVLYNAGASRVPAEELEWSKEMTPALNHALTMQYIVRRDTRHGRLFSLTEAGYTAIGQEAPAHLSISRAFRSIFRIGGGSPD
jgi:hypothetical protein